MTGVSARFGVSGHETKNLVPVDWVSAVMTHVITHPEHHGKTYHLTPLHPVTARLLADIFEEAVGFYAVQLEGSGKPLAGLTEYEQLFCELISVYSSYWKDDPTFDSTNTRTAAPHLPCPHVDRKMLLKMAEYAMRVNFTSPARQADRTQIRRLGRARAAGSRPRSCRAASRSSGARAWGCGSPVTAAATGRLVVTAGDISAVDLGIHSACTAVVECRIDVFAALARGHDWPSRHWPKATLFSRAIQPHARLWRPSFARSANRAGRGPTPPPARCGPWPRIRARRVAAVDVASCRVGRVALAFSLPNNSPTEPTRHEPVPFAAPSHRVAGAVEWDQSDAGLLEFE